MLPYKFTSARFNQPLPRHPSASLSHPPLPKPLKRFSKYLEVVHNLPQSEDHIFTKPMRFHPRPGRSCVAKRTQTEAKDCRYKASADCLAHYCESALNYSHKISGRTAHSPKERRVLTEMTPTKVVLKKPRGRGKSFLMHNFNKTKLCQVRQAGRETETLPLKPKQCLDKINLRKLNETFLISPWNNSLLSDNKENIFC